MSRRVNRAWLGLGATNVEQLWISDSYGLMVAGLVITMGTRHVAARRAGPAAGGLAGSMLGTGLILGSVLPERAGSAASMSETGNYFGGSLGLALLGAVAAVVYRTRMDGTSDSLAGAVAASQHVTGVVAGVIFAGPAVLILAMRPATPATTAAVPGYERTR